MINGRLLHAPPDPSVPTVISDMEGTLSAGVTWKGLRDYLETHGRAPAVRGFIRRRLPQVALYRLRLLPNPEAFQREWLMGLLGLFAGMETAEFDHVSTWLVEQELWRKRRQPLIAELQAHLAAGRRVVLASGLFEPMLAKFAAKVGAEAIGTPLRFDGQGRFTGELDTADFNTGELKAAQARHFIPPNGRLYAAYGDTAADIPLLHLAEQATAVCPDKRLRRAAQQQGWRIWET